MSPQGGSYCLFQCIRLDLSCDESVAHVDTFQSKCYLTQKIRILKQKLIKVWFLISELEIQKESLYMS